MHKKLKSISELDQKNFPIHTQTHTIDVSLDGWARVSEQENCVIFSRLVLFEGKCKATARSHSMLVDAFAPKRNK